MEQDSRLVDFLARFIARFADCDRTDAASFGGHRGIARARDYIEAHLAENLDLSGLAQVAGLSRSHFIRAFQRQTGFSPHAYLTDRGFARRSAFSAGAMRPATWPPPAVSSIRAT